MGQSLPTIEQFKANNELASMIYADTFCANHYNLRNHYHFRAPFTKTAYHGTDSI